MSVAAATRLDMLKTASCRAGDACHTVYRQYLKRTVEEPFALFLPPWEFADGAYREARRFLCQKA
jgi:hypothetical protein